MNEEDFVTYEQAVKLKELGFDWECNVIYRYHSSKIIRKLPKNPHKRKSIKKAIEEYPIITFLKKSTEIEYKDTSWINSYYLDEHKYIDAPTLAQAAKWLREMKEISVTSNINIHEGKYKFNWSITLFKEGRGIWDESVIFDTYEQALSAGIDETLELLKEQENG